MKLTRNKVPSLTRDNLDPRVYLPWYWELIESLVPRFSGYPFHLSPKDFGYTDERWPGLFYNKQAHWPRWFAIRQTINLGEKHAKSTPSLIGSSNFPKVVSEWLDRALASEKLLANPDKIWIDPHGFLITDERIELENWSESEKETFFGQQRYQFRELLEWDVDLKCARFIND